MLHIKGLFFIMSVYYAILGVIFAFFPASFFDYFNVTYPNHWSYAHVIGFSSFIWAVMAWNVAINPETNKNLIPYLVLMHIFYAAGVLVDSGLLGLPNIWVNMAYASVANGILYLAVYYLLEKGVLVEHSASKGGKKNKASSKKTTK